jgi:SPP1 gp7 family putative phage head morphogenesis protein
MLIEPDILTSFDQPFQEALDYFTAKGIEISPTSWRDIWKGANQRAFTVAQVTAADVLVDIKTAVETAIEEGQTLAEFRKSLTPILERKGWLTPPGEDDVDPVTGRRRLAPWRTTTIYRTNLADAYNVGRWKQQEEMAAARPYLQYHNPDDPSSRDEHAAMNGLTYPHDHPIWDTWYPQNGFNCRCWVSSHTQAQAESMTIEDAPPTIDGEPVQPDEGFDYHVGKSGLDAWQPDLKKYDDSMKEKIEEKLEEGTWRAASKKV